MELARAVKIMKRVNSKCENQGTETVESIETRSLLGESKDMFDTLVTMIEL